MDGIAVLITVASALLTITSGQNCSVKYETLPQLRRRTRNYVVAENEPFLRDENLDSSKWYNVDTNNMPTNHSSVKIGHCGTYYPIWMNGTVPNKEDGLVSRMACTVTFDSTCSPKNPISVLNCTTHMIYKLEPTSFTSAYCFDNLQEMPAIIPAPNFTSAFAGVNRRLDFINKTATIIKPQLIFSCAFNKSNDDSMFYSITWYANEAVLETKGPVKYSNITTTELKEEELVNKGFKLGTTIKCSVRASKGIDGELGNITVSLGFWIGIKILTPTVVIKQGGTGVVSLQTTVPFGCTRSETRAPDCGVQVQMYDDLDSYDCTGGSVSVRNREQCGAFIKGSTYQDFRDSKFFLDVTNINVTTKDTQDVNQNRNLFHLKLKTSEDSRLNDIMKNNHLGDISVQVREERAWIGKNCYAHIDPHMMTFDGRTYENQNLGEFVLYRHTEYMQEVQMKTFDCNGPRIKCACAVSVRAGGELFIINVCTITRLINHAHCSEKLMNIRKIHEYQYEIHMPLGTMVTVYIQNWPSPFSSLNIDITPSVKDVNKTIGLCGTLNNNQYDDFTTPNNTVIGDNNAFSNSWKIDKSKSFLDPSNQKPDNWNETLYLCVCPAAVISSTTPVTVSGSSRDPLCSPSVYQACTKNTRNPVIVGDPYNDCSIISKRSLVSQAKELQRILSSDRIVDEKTFHAHSIIKRSLKNYTTEEAKSTCEEKFNRSCLSTSIESLANSTVNKDSALHDCIFDLVATGDLTLIDVHCSSLIAQTERNIRRDKVLRMNHSEEIVSFYSHTCINNCSGHGNCINGTCSCHENYIEQDCSISLKEPPEVLDTYGGGLCSRNNDECCGQLPIYGYRFVSGKTKQKLETIHVMENGTMEIVEATVNDLQILNAFQAFMDVPCHTNTKRSASSGTELILVHGVRVSLTNDGTTYGSSRDFYTYDSMCIEYQQRSDGLTFHLKSGRCYINSVCYSEGEKATSGGCKKCRPVIHPFSFTGECSNSALLLGETVITAPVVVVLAVIVCVSAF